MVVCTPCSTLCTYTCVHVLVLIEQNIISLFILFPLLFGSMERGLLGLVFHPDYETNGYFYINYTRENSGVLSTRVSRFYVDPSTPNVADSSSELVMLAFVQPYSNQ